MFRFRLRSATRYKDTPFYHDLQSCSGFGDRIMDVWAAATVVNLHRPDCNLVIHWSDGLTYQGFVGTYATKLFTVEGCEFVTTPSHGAIPMVKKFSHAKLNSGRGIVPLSSGMQQIILRSGMNWGNTSPDQLYNDLDFYGLSASITLEHLIKTYRDIARSTKPASSVVKGIPGDIKNRVGIHVRLMDKIVSDEHPFDMNERTWQRIERKGYIHIRDCISRGESLFLCADDQLYKKKLARYIRTNGGDVVEASMPHRYRHVPGYESLVDFFALARCTRIIQMTKYSAYSIAAAMVGSTSLVNFYQADNDIGHQLDIWKSALSDVITV